MVYETTPLHPIVKVHSPVSSNGAGCFSKEAFTA
jgi:hypothetical protein